MAFDLSLAGELTMFFDLAFVTLCLALALAVKPHDFFTVGVLPPLLMAALFALLGAVRPASIGAAGDGVVQATISGLAHHSGALVAGYLLCLATLAARRRQLGLPLEARQVMAEEAVDRDDVPASDVDLVVPPMNGPVETMTPVAAYDRVVGGDEPQAGANRVASPAP